jgi:hypothetical protein
MTDRSLEGALGPLAHALDRWKRPFALVGGMGVSIRGEVRFTRDVDLAVSSSNDSETEHLVRDLTSTGYAVIAIVEHTTMKRLATVRLRSPSAVVVDLLTASSGIESEVVGRALPVTIEGAGTIPVARAEELLALKVLSMAEARPQDRIDACGLLAANPTLDLAIVRNLLGLIEQRGYGRGQGLAAKLDALLATRGA